MRCPYCGNDDTQVKDSRPTDDASAIRRRRICNACGGRFTTFERVQLRELMVVKKSGRKEPFQREKLERSVHTAVRKRDIDPDRIEQAELRERVGGLGTRRRLPRRALEALLADRMVDAQPEQAGDRLGAEHVGGLETAALRSDANLPRGGEEARGRDELRVELAHRDEANRVERSPVRLPEGHDRVVQLPAGERVVGECHGGLQSM